MALNVHTLLRRFSTQSNTIKAKICIIGSGPAGFYAAHYLQKRIQPAEIDIFEELPVPFGLVRYGVAPDHHTVKNVQNSFTKTAQLPNVRFLGNVSLGKDVALRQLREAYHVVLLAYGANENKKLNIVGEDSKNVFPARKIVGWYNGLPSDANLDVDLNGEAAVIFGQGNVAIDVARILLTPVDELKTTDITERSLAVLANSKIKSVYLVGRRGPLQAQFTIKEFREMLHLKNSNVFYDSRDFQDVNEDIIAKLPRQKKRLAELLLRSFRERTAPDLKIDPNKKEFRPQFYRSPTEIVAENENNLKIKCNRNVLKGDDGDILNKMAVPTDESEWISANLAVTSIGYKSIQVDSDIPFDSKSGTVRNTKGKIEKGFYTCGWLSTGPTGVLVTTMNEAFATADGIVKEISKENLVNEQRPGYEEIKKILDSKGCQIVTWSDWLKIDQYEKMAGEALNKPREKITDVNKMLEVAAGS